MIQSTKLYDFIDFTKKNSCPDVLGDLYTTDCCTERAGVLLRYSVLRGLVEGCARAPFSAAALRVPSVILSVDGVRPRHRRLFFNGETQLYSAQLCYWVKLTTCLLCCKGDAQLTNPFRWSLQKIVHFWCFKQVIYFDRFVLIFTCFKWIEGTIDF